MRPVAVHLNTERSGADGCRRYRPIEYTFDARSNTLDMEVQDTWEPEIQQQWRANQAYVRMGLLAEHGTVDGETKIADFTALGPAPISIVHVHNEYLAQVRSAFTHGDYYPALVGGCTLGERILNELLQTLLPDFEHHPATTKRVRNLQAVTDWRSASSILLKWGAISATAAEMLVDLGNLRHRVVHYSSTLAGSERSLALKAIHLVQDVIADVFAALGGPPRFIADTAGVSFIALAAESDPLIKRIFLPRCVLVSPAHVLQMQRSATGAEVGITDDADYPQTSLTDAEFAAAYPTGAAALGAHLRRVSGAP